MRALAVGKGTFVTLSALRFRAGAKPAVTFSRRNALAGCAAAPVFVRTERTGPSLRRAPASPILIWTLVTTLFEAERIERFLHFRTFPRRASRQFRARPRGESSCR